MIYALLAALWESGFIAYRQAQTEPITWLPLLGGAGALGIGALAAPIHTRARLAAVALLCATIAVPAFGAPDDSLRSQWLLRECASAFDGIHPYAVTALLLAVWLGILRNREATQADIALWAGWTFLLAARVVIPQYSAEVWWQTPESLGLGGAALFWVAAVGARFMTRDTHA